MLEKIIALDAFALRAVQGFIDRQQPLTGLNKFMFEKWIMIFIVLFAGAAAFVYGNTVLMVLAGAYCVAAVLIVRGIETKEMVFLVLGLSYTERVYTSFARLIFVAFFVILLTCSFVGGYGPFIDVALITCILSVYASSCIPRSK